MNEQQSFPENVILIDAHYLDKVSGLCREQVSQIIGRELPPVDIAILIECMALDAGIPVGDNQTLVVSFYDEKFSSFSHCTPSNIATELNDTAFKGAVGEFTFTAQSCSTLNKRPDMFKEVVQLLLDSKEVKNILLLPHTEEYELSIDEEYVSLAQEKRPHLFCLEIPEASSDFLQYQPLSFALVKAAGVSPTEL